MGLKLIHENLSVLDPISRRLQHDAELTDQVEFQTRRVLLREMAQKQLESSRNRLYVHLLLLLAAMGMALIFLTLLWIDNLLPVLPQPLTFQAMREWTLTPAWRVPVAWTVIGMCIAFTITHGRKVYFHAQLVRDKKRLLQPRKLFSAAPH